MFLGHFGVALAAKRAAPRVSLGWLFAATQLPDLVWPVLVAMGIERVRIAPGATAFTPLVFEHYPWSHSLLMVAVWALVAGAVYHARSRHRTGALLVGVLVVSHWVLDWITHAPDLPLYPGGSLHMGLGLWHSVTATLAIELVIILAGAMVYARTTRPLDRTGRYAIWALALFLLAVQFANALGPPPPDIRAIIVAGSSIWLLVLWAWWADRHRETTPGTSATARR